MTKKYDLEYVRRYFEERGCEVLSDQYIDVHTPVSYRCVCGNVWSTSLSNFKRGHRCRACKNEKISKSERLDVLYVRQFMSEHGCVLLGEYVNAQTPFEYVCECGNIASITWLRFRRGQRCKNCKIRKLSGANNYRWNPDRDAVKQNTLNRRRYYSLLHAALNGIGKRKYAKSYQLLGYGPTELRRHLENHANRPTVGDDYEVDHIFPLKAFIDYGIVDVDVINGLDNLRPIAPKDNKAKKDHYDPAEFEQWLFGKGYEIYAS